MPRMTGPAPSTSKPSRPRFGFARYWEATQEPLYCLLLLLPLVATYEFSAMMLRPVPNAESPLVAHLLLHRFLSWFGGTSVWLPGLVLLGALLAWHVATRNAWRVHLVYFPIMVLESLLLTVPLFVIGRLEMAAVRQAGLGDRVVLALGAGIFEELVFRLCLIGALLLFFRDALNVRKSAAAVFAISIAALLFALCHFKPIGNIDWAWLPFTKLLLDGVYLSFVFVGRGLGIATSCHAAYNIMLAFLVRAP